MTKPGYYRVLKQWVPAQKYWTCGDGCCSGWDDDAAEDYNVGDLIYVDEYQVGDSTYEIGSSYEGLREENYRPSPCVDYITEGILEFVK